MTCINCGHVIPVEDINLAAMTAVCPPTMTSAETPETAHSIRKVAGTYRLINLLVALPGS